MKKFGILAVGIAWASCAMAEPAGVVNFYNWTDYIAETTLPAFTKSSGVKVNYDMYDSNDVLRAKLMTGHSGYDLVVPSNNTLDRLIKGGFFRPLDAGKIPNLKNLDPQLMQMMSKFDPGNKYSVPYFWGVITLGINKEKVSQVLGKVPDNPWDMIFKAETVAKLKTCGVSVLDSPGEVFPLALKYFGKNPDSENLADYQAITPALKEARKGYTRISSSSFINDLAGGSVCVAMGYNGGLNIAKRRAMEAKKPYTLEVLLPKQGTMLWVDSLAVPKDAPNPENAFKLVNHLLDAKVSAANINAVNYPSGVPAAKPFVDKVYSQNRTVFISAEELKNSFLPKTLSEKTNRGMTRLWQEIKTLH